MHCQTWLYPSVCRFVKGMQHNFVENVPHRFVLSELKKRSFLISCCVFWFVFLNSSSHLCFRFLCAISTVQENNNSRLGILLVSFETRGSRRWPHKCMYNYTNLYNMLCLLPPGPLIYTFPPSWFFLLHFLHYLSKHKTATCLELWEYFDMWSDELCFTPILIITCNQNGWQGFKNQLPTNLLVFGIVIPFCVPPQEG